MVLTHNELKELVNNGVITNQTTGNVIVDIVSIDLHIDDHFMVYDEYPKTPFTPPAKLKTRTESIGRQGEYILPPMGKVLTCSEEGIKMPLDLIAFIQAKGSLARGFLMIHLCDSQIDPGYQGKITFGISNLSDFYYRLIPGMPVAKLLFCKLAFPVDRGYNGRYQNSGMPTCMQPPKK